MSDDPHPALRALFSQPKMRWAAMGLGVLLVVTALRIWFIDEFSSPLPYFDQWLLETPYYFAALGNLQLQDLFAPANEHRIFWTRLISLGLFLGNDHHWDPQVQMTVNAVIAGATAGLLAVGIGRGLPRPRRMLLVVVTTTLFVLPVGWHNTLWGIQSLMFLLVFFSVAGIFLTIGAPLRSVRFWVGIFCLAAALLTMGSGFLAAAVVFGVALWSRIHDRDFRLASLLLPAITLALTCAGLLLAPGSGKLSGLGADSLGDFFLAFARNWVFPFSIETTLSSFGWIGLVSGVPVVVLVLLYFFGKVPEPQRRAMEPLLAIGAWILLQFLVVALTRGQDGRGPTWRHFDVHLLWPLVNLTALFWLVQLSRRPLIALPPRIVRSLLVLWIAIILTGTLQLSALGLREAGFRKQFSDLQERTVNNFLITGDPAPLRAGKSLQDIPAPANEVLPVLQSPLGPAILPAGIRRPLQITVGQDSQGAFAAGGSLPEPVPPPVGLNTWASPSDNAQPVLFASTPLVSNAHYLQVLVAGDAPNAGSNLHLYLRADQGQQQEPFVKTPVRSAPWQLYRARVPEGSFRLVAVDESPTKAMAFSAPVETGRLTAWVTDWRTRWEWLLLSGLLLLLSANPAFIGSKPSESPH